MVYKSSILNKVEIPPLGFIIDDHFKLYMKRYNPQYAIRISTKNFGFANNIKSLPLYATFGVK